MQNPIIFQCKETSLTKNFGGWEDAHKVIKILLLIRVD